MSRLRVTIQALVLLAGTLAVSGCWHRPGYARRGYYNGRYDGRGYYDGRGRGYYQRGYVAPRPSYAPRGGYVPPPAPAYRY